MVSTQQSSREFNTRPTTPTGNATQTYDLTCIGFGPAQIATAIANRESRNPSKILFLEKEASFSWHPSSHLPRSRMENAFIYDLATPRNPRSAFSYVNYLLAQNRLVEFANSDQLNPLREEFEDYLRWCAEQFKEQVRYGSEVVGVIPEKEGDTVQGWNVAIREQNGSAYMVRTKNIAVPSPPGGRDSKLRPLTSVNFEAGQRIISMDHYLSKRNELRAPHEPRLDIALVGSGQQTIETLDDLLSSHHVGNITVVTENEALAPLRVLSEEASPPPPRLCSIWAKPSCESKSTITGASELVKTIYGRAYEKQLSSKGKYSLRVVVGRDASGPTAQSSILLTENTGGQASSTGLFHGLDALVLGCRQKGESLEEVQFKRGAVAEDCRMWMLSAHSDGGRALAKDIAMRAGDVVKALGEGAGARDGVMMITARM